MHEIIAIFDIAGYKVAPARVLQCHASLPPHLSRLKAAALTFDLPMNATVSRNQILGGFSVAAVTLVLGIYFDLKAGGDGGTALLRIFHLLAVLIVLKFTFAWGRIRGFPARRKDGSISVSHVLRNLVMAAIVWGLLAFLTAPFMMLAFKLTR